MYFSIKGSDVITGKSIGNFDALLDPRMLKVDLEGVDAMECKFIYGHAFIKIILWSVNLSLVCNYKDNLTLIVLLSL